MGCKDDIVPEGWVNDLETRIGQGTSAWSGSEVLELILSHKRLQSDNEKLKKDNARLRDGLEHAALCESHHETATMLLMLIAGRTWDGEVR